MRTLQLALIALVTIGTGVYLAASGARPGAPVIFMLLAAVTLAITVRLLSRSAMALMREPAADQVRVATGRRRKELEREKQSILKALKELEFDHEMHKISEADFREIASAYRARAVRVMRSLDENDADDQRVSEAAAAKVAPIEGKATRAKARVKA